MKVVSTGRLAVVVAVLLVIGGGIAYTGAARTKTQPKCVFQVAPSPGGSAAELFIDAHAIIAVAIEQYASTASR